MNIKIFKKITEEDLEFVVTLRNSNIEFLHNPIIFSTEDSKKWFSTTKPNWYICKLNNKNIGYFRTSLYDGKSIYIGLDLKEEYRNNGLGTRLLKAFIWFIKRELPIITSVKCEVLSTNTRSLKVMEKVGFKIINENTIIRNNKEVKNFFLERKYEI